MSTLLLSVCTVDKSKVEISQNFVAFSEYTNFNHFLESKAEIEKKICWDLLTFTYLSLKSESFSYCLYKLYFWK